MSTYDFCEKSCPSSIIFFICEKVHGYTGVVATAPPTDLLKCYWMGRNGMTRKQYRATFNEPFIYVFYLNVYIRGQGNRENSKGNIRGSNQKIKKCIGIRMWP